MAELYAGESIGAIVLVTGFLGGGAAWLSGRAIAGAWHPPWHVALVALVLGAAARFIHFALFHGELLSAPSYACDTLILFIVGLLAWRATSRQPDGAAISLALYPRRPLAMAQSWAGRLPAAVIISAYSAST